MRGARDGEPVAGGRPRLQGPAKAREVVGVGVRAHGLGERQHRPGAEPRARVAGEAVEVHRGGEAAVLRRGEQGRRPAEGVPGDRRAPCVEPSRQGTGDPAPADPAQPGEGEAEIRRAHRRPTGGAALVLGGVPGGGDLGAHGPPVVQDDRGRVVGVVQRGHRIAVGGEFLRPGRVLGAHPAEARGEQHHREGPAPRGDRCVRHRVPPRGHRAVQGEGRQPGVAGQGVPDRPRLVRGPAEVVGPRTPGPVRRVPQLGHHGAPVPGLGGGGLRPVGVRPLHRGGAHPVRSGGLGEHRHGQGPGGRGPGRDQHAAEQRRGPRRPPRRPARRTRRAPAEHRGEREGKRQGRGGQHGHQLPPEAGQGHGARGGRHRPGRGERGRAAGRGRQPAGRDRSGGGEDEKCLGEGQMQPRDRLGHTRHARYCARAAASLRGRARVPPRAYTAGARRPPGGLIAQAGDLPGRRCDGRHPGRA